MSSNMNDDFGEFFDAATSTSEVTMSTGGGAALKHIQPSYVSQQSALTDVDSTEVSGFGDFADAYSGLEDTTYPEIITKPTDGILNSNGSALDNDPFASLVPETVQHQISPSFVSFPPTSTITTSSEPTINIHMVEVSESSNEFGDFVEVPNPLASSSNIGVNATANTSFDDVGIPTALDLGKIPEHNGYSSQLPNITSFIPPNIIDQTQSDDPFAALGPVNDAPIPSIASYDSNEQDIIMHESTNVTSPINTTNSNLYEPSALVGMGIHDPSTMVQNHYDIVNNDVLPIDMSDINAVTDAKALVDAVVQISSEDDDFGDFVAPTKSTSPVFANGLKGNGVPIMSDTKAFTDISTSFNTAAQISSENDDFGDFVAPTTPTNPLAISTAYSGGSNGAGPLDIFTNSDTMQQQVYDGISADDIQSYNTITTTDAAIGRPYSMSTNGLGDVVAATTDIAMHTGIETLVSNAVVLDDLADPFATIATETNQAVDLPSYLLPSLVPTTGGPIEVVDVSESSNDFGDFVEVPKAETTSSNHVGTTTTTAFGDVQTNTALEFGMNSGILQSRHCSSELSQCTSAPSPQAIESSQLEDPFAALGATSDAPIASTFQHDFMEPNPSDVVNPTNVYPYETSAPVGFEIHDPLEVDMINNHEPIETFNNFGTQQTEIFKMDNIETTEAITSCNTALISTDVDNDEFGDFVAPNATANPLNLENAGDANGGDVHDVFAQDKSIQEYKVVNSDSDPINYPGTTKIDAVDVLLTTAVSHETELEGANDNLTQAVDEIVNSNIFVSNDYKDPFASIVTEASQSFDIPPYMEPMVEMQESVAPTADAFLYGGIKSEVITMEPSSAGIVNNGSDGEDDFGDFGASPATQISRELETKEKSLPSMTGNFDFGGLDSTPEIVSKADHRLAAQISCGANVISTDVDYFASSGTSETVEVHFGQAPVLQGDIAKIEQEDDDDFGDFDAAPITHVENSVQSTNVSVPDVVDGGACENFETVPELCVNKIEVDEFGVHEAFLDLQVAPNIELEKVTNDEFGDFDSVLVAAADNAIPDIVVDKGFVAIDASQFAPVVDLLQPRTEMVSAVEDDIDFGGFDTAPEMSMQITVQSIKNDNAVESEVCGEFTNPLEADVKDSNTALPLNGNSVDVDHAFGDFSGEQSTHTDNPFHHNVPSDDEIEFKEFDAASAMTVQDVPVPSADFLGTANPEDDGFGDFDAAPLASKNNQQTVLDTADENDFGDFDAAPESTEMNVPVYSSDVGIAASVADDGFGAYDASTPVATVDQQAMQHTTDIDNDFGDFDAAPESTEMNVPVDSSDVGIAASVADDGFGSFDAATPVATVGQQATQHTTDIDNDFGDFDAASESTEMNVPVDSSDVGIAASVADDGFGSFDAATPVATVNQQDDDDDFGDFDAAPELTEPKAPVHSTDIPNVAIAEGDSFGDFDAAAPVTTKSQIATQTTTNEDDDFGDFDTAAFESVSDVHSNDVANDNFGAFDTSPPKIDADDDDDDDDFGDFDAAPSESVSDQVTDKKSETSLSVLVISQAFINDPIISNIRSVMPTFFTNDEGSDAEEEEAVPLVELKEESIEEILNILDTGKNKPEDLKCYQSVIDVLFKASAPVDEETVVVDNNNCKYFDRYGHVWYPVGRRRTNNDVHTKDTNETSNTTMKRAVFLPTSITDASTNVPVQSNSQKNNITPNNLSPAPFVPTETIVSIPPKQPKVSKK